MPAGLLGRVCLAALALLEVALAATESTFRVALLSEYVSLGKETFYTGFKWGAQYVNDKFGGIPVGGGAPLPIEIVEYDTSGDNTVGGQATVSVQQAARGEDGTNQPVGDVHAIIAGTASTNGAIRTEAQIQGMPNLHISGGNPLDWVAENTYAFGMHLPFTEYTKGPMKLFELVGMKSIGIIRSQQHGFPSRSTVAALKWAQLANLAVVGPSKSWCDSFMNATVTCQVVDGNCRCGEQDIANDLGLGITLTDAPTFYEVVEPNLGTWPNSGNVDPAIVEYHRAIFRDMTSQGAPDVLLNFAHGWHNVVRAMVLEDFTPKVLLGWQGGVTSTWAVDSTGLLSQEHGWWAVGFGQWHKAIRYADPVFGTSQVAVELFEQEFQRDLDYDTAGGIATAVVLHTAMKQYADTSWVSMSLAEKRDAIRAAVGDMNDDTMWGPVRFNRYNQNSGRGTAAWQVIADLPLTDAASSSRRLSVLSVGQKCILPTEAAETSLRYPFPSWTARFEGCAPGQYNTGSSCEACPVGTFQSSSTPGMLAAEVPDGEYVIQSSSDGLYLQGTQTGSAAARWSVSSSDGSLYSISSGDGYLSTSSGAVSLLEADAASKWVVAATSSSGVYTIREEGTSTYLTVAGGSMSVQSSADANGTQWHLHVESLMAFRSCSSCSSGKEANATGMSECSACPKGRYKGFDDSTLCAPCRAGRMAPDTGMVECNECGPGTFTAMIGQEQCEDCPVGKFTAGGPTTTCDNCSEGTFTLEPGQSVCQSCGVGVGSSECTEETAFRVALLTEYESAGQWQFYRGFKWGAKYINDKYGGIPVGGGPPIPIQIVEYDTGGDKTIGGQAAVAVQQAARGDNATNHAIGGDIHAIIAGTASTNSPIRHEAQLQKLANIHVSGGNPLDWVAENTYAFGMHLPFTEYTKGPMKLFELVGMKSIGMIRSQQHGFPSRSTVAALKWAQLASLEVVGPSTSWCDDYMNKTVTCKIVNGNCRCGEQDIADALGLGITLTEIPTFYEVVEPNVGTWPNYGNIDDAIVEYHRAIFRDMKTQGTPDVLLNFAHGWHNVVQAMILEDFVPKVLLGWQGGVVSTWAEDNTGLLSQEHGWWAVGFGQWHKAIEYADPVFGSSLTAVQLYEDEFQQDLGYDCAGGIAAAVVLYTSMKQYADDSWAFLPIDEKRDAVRAAIGDMNDDTLWGPVRFNRYNQNSGRGTAAWQVIPELPEHGGGRRMSAIPVGQKCILPSDAAETTLRYPFPSWSSRFSGCDSGEYNTGSECKVCELGTIQSSATPGMFSSEVPDGKYIIESLSVAGTHLTAGSGAAVETSSEATAEGATWSIAANGTSYHIWSNGKYLSTSAQSSTSLMLGDHMAQWHIASGSSSGSYTLKELGTDRCLALVDGSLTVQPTADSDGTEWHLQAQSLMAFQPCSTCPKGKEANTTGMSECTECPAGRYKSLDDDSLCQPCSPGKAAPVPGMVACNECGAGTYTSLEGQETCTDCAMGRFAGSVATAACSECESGKFTVEVGQSVCLSCGVGGAGVGSDECTEETTFRVALLSEYVSSGGSRFHFYRGFKWGAKYINEMFGGIPVGEGPPLPIEIVEYDTFGDNTVGGQAATAVQQAARGDNSTGQPVGDIHAIIAGTSSTNGAIRSESQLQGMPNLHVSGGNPLDWVADNTFAFGMHLPFTEYTKGPMKLFELMGMKTLGIIRSQQHGFPSRSTVAALKWAQLASLSVVGPSKSWCEAYMNKTVSCQIVDGSCRCGEQDIANSLGLGITLTDGPTFYEVVEPNVGTWPNAGNVDADIVEYHRAILRDMKTQGVPDVLLNFAHGWHNVVRAMVLENFVPKVLLGWQGGVVTTWAVDKTGLLSEEHGYWAIGFGQWHKAIKYPDPVFGTNQVAVGLYEEEFQQDLDYDTAGGIASAVVLYVAMKQYADASWSILPIDKKRDAVRAAIGDMNDDTMWGPVRFNRYNQNSGRGTAAWQVLPELPRHGGGRRLSAIPAAQKCILPSEAAETTLQHPFPSWSARFSGCQSGEYNTGSGCEVCQVGTFQELAMPGMFYGEVPDGDYVIESSISVGSHLAVPDNGASVLLSSDTSATKAKWRVVMINATYAISNGGSYLIPSLTGTDVSFEESAEPALRWQITQTSSKGVYHIQAGSDANKYLAAAADGPAKVLASGDGDEAKWHLTAESLMAFQPCSACPSGREANTSGMSACTDCPTGRFKAFDDSSLCMPCSAGRVAPRPGMSACSECGPGTFQGEAGKDACEDCPTGKFAGSAATTACTNCSAGTFTSEVGKQACKSCLVGKYQSDPGTTACTSCPSGEITLEWTNVAGDDQWVPKEMSINTDACGCGPTTKLEGGVCVDCGKETSTGLVCRGKDDIKIAPGFYAEAGSLSVFSCYADTKRCPGGYPGSTCAEGREGISCAHCKAGMKAHAEGYCIPCAESGQDSAVFVTFCTVMILSLIALYLVMDSRGGAPQSHVLLLCGLTASLMITLVQQLGIMAMFKNIEWPEPLNSMMGIMGLVQFNVELLNLNCVVKIRPLQLLLTKLGVVGGGAAIIVVLHCIVVIAKHRSAFRERMPSLIGCIGTLLTVFYISVVTLVLGPLQCLKSPNGKWTSAEYQSVVCWESDEHVTMIVVGLFALSVPIAFFTQCALVTRRFPQMMSEGRVDYLRSYIFLFFRYKSEAYWYCMVHMTRSLLLGLCPILPDVSAQIIIMQAVLTAQLMLIVGYTPWRVNSANFLDTFFTVVAMFVLSAASFYVPEDPGPVLGWVALLTILACVISFPIIVIRALWRSIALKSKKDFQFFLCHHKAGAGAFVRLLKMQLQSMKGVSGEVFVDCDNLTDLDGLFDQVANLVENLVMCCTREILLRPWCMGEIATTMQKGVGAIKLALPDFEDPSDEFIASYADLVKDMTVLSSRGIGLEHAQEAMYWFRGLEGYAVRTLKDNDIMIIADYLLNPAKHAAARSAAAGNSDRPPELESPLTLDDEDGDMMVMESTVNTLSDGDGVMKKKSSTAASGSRSTLILADTESLEATSAALVLSRLLVGHFSHTPEDIPKVVFNYSEFREVSANVKIIMLVCTKGILDQRRMLLQLDVACSANPRWLPIIAEDGFSFPTVSTLSARLDELARPQDSLDVTESAQRIQSIFVQIGIGFPVSMASEALLLSRSQEIADRLHQEKKKWAGQPVAAANHSLSISHRQSNKSEKLLAVPGAPVRGPDAVQFKKTPSQGPDTAQFEKIPSLQPTGAAAGETSEADSPFEAPEVPMEYGLEDDDRSPKNKFVRAGHGHLAELSMDTLNDHGYDYAN